MVFDKQGGVGFTDNGCSTPRRPQVRCALPKPGPKALRDRAARATTSSRQRRRPLADEKVVYVADHTARALWAFDMPNPACSRRRACARAGDQTLDGFSYLRTARREAGGLRSAGHPNQRRHHAFARTVRSKQFPVRNLICHQIASAAPICGTPGSTPRTPASSSSPLAAAGPQGSISKA